MTLFVWLALFRSPGVSPVEKARPRLLVLRVLVGILPDVLVEELLLGVLVPELLLVVLLLAETERMVKEAKRNRAKWKKGILGEAGSNSKTGPRRGLFEQDHKKKILECG